MGSISWIFLLSHILTTINLTTAQICGETGNFTSNTTYAKNRNLILSSLAYNVTRLTPNSRFYTGSIGEGPDKVYALVLCRGDTLLDYCSSCVNFSVQKFMDKCPNQKEAISWQQNPPCLVRYSNHSMFGRLELSPNESYAYPANFLGNMERLDQTWTSLMDMLVTKASMGSSRLKMATGEANLTSTETIYSLMQCTPDLSQNDCRTCLQALVGSFKRCCYGNKGGWVHAPSCIYRHEVYKFYNSSADTSVTSPTTLPSIPAPSPGTKATKVAIIVVPVIIFMALVALSTYALFRRKKTKQVETEDEISKVESLQFDFGIIRVATSNFCNDNMLGKGGFGYVYKGRLPNGKDVAVKRLSRDSGQGEEEFKNEVLLMARLQHRNLVRLLGFCLEGKERLLIYEFLHNSSLNHFIFDPIKCSQLDWEMRYNIIGGIARGLLYLHEDSQYRIIHRDLKASNILLDEKMNPKISDFGMARLFAMDQTQSNTSKIVGTFGYMAPEYVMRGHFSVKSDVFSFGVLVLEIISGQKISSFRHGEEAEDLLTYAWTNWNEGTASNLIDPILQVGSRGEMERYIHIGLLCVQENVVDRPTMASIVLMLSSCSLTLPLPSKPAFFMHTTMEPETSSSVNRNPESIVPDQSKCYSMQLSVNETSISELYPR